MVPKTRPKIIFFGTPVFSKVCLQALFEDPRFEVALVITNPDRPAGRGKKMQASPVKEFALEKGIPCITAEKISKNIPLFLEQIAPFGPFTIGVVVAFGQLLPIEVLHTPQHHSINVHGSLLPRWRGAAPMQRAIMEGDTETGVQLMQMDAGLDTGAVYSTLKTQITEHTTLSALHDTLALLGAQALKNDLLKIIDGTLVAVPQSNVGITVAKKITNEEARIDWSWDAKRLIRHIHGISPFPGAFTLLHGLRLKIFRASVRPNAAEGTTINTSYAPGTVTYAGSDELRVTTGTQEIAILELQLEGKKRMLTKEFLSGVPMAIGQKFD